MIFYSIYNKDKIVQPKVGFLGVLPPKSVIKIKEEYAKKLKVDYADITVRKIS